MASTLAPGFLIAMPQLLDDNFRRSVVLVIEHGEQGSLGLVINQVSEYTIGKFAGQLGIDLHADPAQLVHIGGPVGREGGWILHPNADGVSDSHELLDGVSLSRSVTALREIFEKGTEPFRLYMGYAGWGPGQLENEITHGAWITSDPDPDLIFTSSPQDIWERSLTKMGIQPLALVPGGPEIN